MSPPEKLVSHGKCEDRAWENVKSKLAGTLKEPDFGSWGRPKDPFEVQGPLCLEGTAFSP